MRRRASAQEVIAPVCALIMAAAFAGCSEPDPTGGPPDAAGDADATPPFVIRYLPGAGDVAVPPDVTVIAAFNKPMTNISSFSFTLTRHDTESLVAAFVEYDPITRTASLDPQQAALDRARTYVATLTPDIVDADGAALVGTTSWMFSIAPDTRGPEVIAMSPPVSASNVAVDSTIKATFDEPLATLPTNAFVLDGPAGRVMASFALGPNNVVSLTPKLQLAPQTTYTATLSPEIRDTAGNALLNGPVQWTFTTDVDTVAPMITTRFPEIDDSGIQVSADVTVRFSEPIIGLSTASMTLDQGGTLVPATVTYLANVPAARLTPSAPLAPSTTYTITLTSAITDASGNALAPPASWHFETSTGF